MQSRDILLETSPTKYTCITISWWTCRDKIKISGNRTFHLDVNKNFYEWAHIKFRHRACIRIMHKGFNRSILPTQKTCTKYKLKTTTTHPRTTSMSSLFILFWLACIHIWSSNGKPANMKCTALHSAWLLTSVIILYVLQALSSGVRFQCFSMGKAGVTNKYYNWSKQ